jgi:hypothetical protein
MLTRPLCVSEPTVVIAAPIILYKLAEMHLSTLNLTWNCDSLVPSEIIEGKDFENFMATWLALRLQMGHSLKTILSKNSSNCGEILECHLGIRHKTLWVEKDDFWGDLSNEVVDSVYFDLQRPEATDNSFGFSKTKGADMEVIMPKDTTNAGFDIICGNNKDKTVLLIQAKATVICTQEKGGTGQVVDNGKLIACINRCAGMIGWFLERDWKV